MKVIFYLLFLLSTSYSLESMIFNKSSICEEFSSSYGNLQITANIFTDAEKKGYISFSPDMESKMGRIILLKIDKESRGNGLGTLLMQHALNSLATTYHCTEITWTAYSRKTSRLPDLIRFYERLGGVATSRTYADAEFKFIPTKPS